MATAPVPTTAPAPQAEEQPSLWRYRKGDPPKMVEIDMKTFRILSKYVAKRHGFDKITPTDALAELFKEFDIEGKC